MKRSIRTLVGNIFESKAQTLVNTVNAVGVMGKGIALEFKKRFPEMYNDYVKRCERGDVKLGEPYVYKSDKLPWIINFPTKDHWRSVSRIEDIEKGLKYILRNYKRWGIRSLAVPPLGCGQGQLDWQVVGRTLYRYLNKLDIGVELYAPFGTPREELQLDFLAEMDSEPGRVNLGSGTERIKPAWVALVEILHRLEKRPYRWPVGRTIFQKIAFVATLIGLPTGLRYDRGSYGPFSPDIKGIISRLVNNGLISEERWRNMFLIHVGPTFNDARQSYDSYLSPWESEISKIVDLFSRVNSTQAEVIASVLFAESEIDKSTGRKPTEYDILTRVLEWKQRRRPKLDDHEIAYTIRNLAALGWLDALPSEKLPLPAE